MSLHFRDSDSELAYATPVGSFWLPTAPGLDGRQRRSRGSSDDNEDQDYPENFVNTDYRAGGPYLAPSPVKTYNLPSYYSSFEALRENPHYAAVRGILRKWEVEIRDYGVSMRRAQFYPNDKPIPTLYIVSRKRRQDESWVSAALEIRAYLVNRGFKDVSVEIADQLAFRQALCFPVHNTDSIYPLWDKVCDSILGTFDLTDWRILECFRHGFSSNRFDNPPTVMVTVDRRSTKKWKKVRESIIEILKGFGLGGVAVRISKGSVMLAAGPPHEEIPSAAWEGRAMLGVSMGPSENPYGSATFGGFIELMNREKKWFKFGLTCYHAILPSLIYEQQESELRKRKISTDLAYILFIRHIG